MKQWFIMIAGLLILPLLGEQAAAHIPIIQKEKANNPQSIEMVKHHKHKRPPPKRKREGRQGAQRTRQHTTTEAKPLQLMPANVQLNHTPLIRIYTSGNKRIIESNVIPKHRVGSFPHRGNPNAISPQSLKLVLPLNPQKRSTPIFAQLATFGIGLNGVVIEPGAAEWYLGQRNSKWQYEALGGAISLGLDEHYAHVQPNGMYHYHGLAKGLNAIAKDGHIGWAYDGYPIFTEAHTSLKGSIRQTSSYRLKPSRSGEVPGKPDGAFVADYAYSKGAGSLDECNGTTIATKDFPNGTYAYFLTHEFPFIPRCFRATPISGAIKGRR